MHALWVTSPPRAAYHNRDCHFHVGLPITFCMGLTWPIYRSTNVLNFLHTTAHVAHLHIEAVAIHVSNEINEQLKQSQNMPTIQVQILNKISK